MNEIWLVVMFGIIFIIQLFVLHYVLDFLKGTLKIMNNFIDVAYDVLEVVVEEKNCVDKDDKK